MSFNAYENYKDSEIKWIGNIPEHWDIKPLKYLANTIPGGTPSTNKLEYWENGDIPWLPSGVVQNCEINEEDVNKFITFEGLVNSATKYIGPSSVLIALTGATCANIGFLTFKATANQSVISIEPYTFVPKYLFYYLLSQREQILINKTGGAQSGINEENVKNISTVSLSISEQNKIVNFLDNEILKIDINISKNKDLISLLEEKKVALINHVVTNGLNNDIPMKDSGIDWIGKIPAHWDLHKLKRFVTLHNGKEINTEIYGDDEGAINVYGSGGVFKFTDEYLFDGEAVLFGRKGTIGKPIYLDEKFWAVDTVYYLTFNDLLIPKYCYYSLILYPWEKITTSTAKPSVVGSDVTNSMFVIPTKDDQFKIVKFLDKEILNIDTIINKIQYQIDLLEEYKNSLIYQAVTGKIDVRGEI